jgi:hypothetical protein
MASVNGKQGPYTVDPICEKTRSNVISDSVKEAVVAWWISEIRPSPIAKEVVRKWVAPGDAYTVLARVSG